MIRNSLNVLYNQHKNVLLSACRSINYKTSDNATKTQAAVSDTEKQPVESANVPEQEVVNPLKHADFFNVANLFTIKDLFNANVHLGHREGTLNPFMKPYIFGSRLGHLILDLDQTAFHLRQALNIAAHIAFRKGIIVFISRNSQTMIKVEETAKECGEFAICRFWKGGIFTNSQIVFHEVIRLPDLVIFLNTHNVSFGMHEAVIQAAKLLIPTIGIVDTSADPRIITYPVPGNDDSKAAIHLYCDLFKRAIINGKLKRKELEEKGIPFVA